MTTLVVALGLLAGAALVAGAVPRGTPRLPCGCAGMDGSEVCGCRPVRPAGSPARLEARWGAPARG